jgi:CBS domain-containing protein
MILARDIMTRDVVTVPMELDLKSAALMLISHRISGAPVVDTSRMLVGVLSARDLIRQDARNLDARRNGRLTRDELATLADIHHDFENHPASHLKVMDVMTPYAVSAAEDTPAVEVAQIMCKEQVHRVLILDDGRLTGIISSMDMVRAIASTSLGNLLKHGRPNRKLKATARRLVRKPPSRKLLPRSGPATRARLVGRKKGGKPARRKAAAVR